MQNFIASVLIGLACLYLIFKWMPKSRMQVLQAWLFKNAPLLGHLVPADAKNCSGGCSTCGNCGVPDIKTNKINQAKVIQIIRNP
jgi:hypothetical protein